MLNMILCASVIAKHAKHAVRRELNQKKAFITHPPFSKNNRSDILHTPLKRSLLYKHEWLIYDSLQS